MTANFIIEVVKSIFGISDTDEPAASEPPEDGTDVTIERESGMVESEPKVSESEATADTIESADEADVDEVSEAVETEAVETEADTETTEEEVTEEEIAEEEPETETAVAETDAAETADSIDDAQSDMAVSVGEINGIGPTYSERLTGAGIETVADLAAAEAAVVADAAEVSEKRATDWIDQASEF